VNPADLLLPCRGLAKRGHPSGRYRSSLSDESNVRSGTQAGAARRALADRCQSEAVVQLAGRRAGMQRQPTRFRSCGSSKVVRLFELLHNFTVKEGPSFQIIVTEHANPRANPQMLIRLLSPTVDLLISLPASTRVASALSCRRSGRCRSHRSARTPIVAVLASGTQIGIARCRGSCVCQVVRMGDHDVEAGRSAATFIAAFFCSRADLC